MKMSRGEMQDLLAKFSMNNPGYREALLKDPKEVVAEQFQMKLPEGIQVKAVQETADTIYVVVPHVVEEGAELDDADLETLAGGFLDKEANCEDATLSTVVEINASLF